MARTLIKTFLILLYALSFPFTSFSEEIYEFERMWPVLGQPWYFSHPNGVALDSSGNVYVADTGNNRIQKFTSSGQFITKWGSEGNGDGQFSSPHGIALDSNGNIYVADTGNNRIQKFTSSGQFITKWGSEGNGDGEFSVPRSIALDSSGNIYVAEEWNHRIQKFASNGQFITKWGSRGSGNGQFLYPYGIALDSSGNVYVTDTYNHRIQEFTSGGQFVTKWGSKGSGNGQFSYPKGIALDSNGNVYVAEEWNHRIQKFASNGQFITKWGSSGNGDGELLYPYGIALDSSGNVYVADTFNHRIQKFTSSGQFITKWGSSGNGDGQFDQPGGIAIDNSGNVYVVDGVNHRIQKFTSSGQFITKWGSKGSGDAEFFYPYGIALDSSGNVYVADMWNYRIQKFTSNGQLITKWGSYGSGDGQFDRPGGIALDSSGNIYLAEEWNHRIQKFASNGQFITKWGSEGNGDGQFSSPHGIALDSSGNVYVADTGNHRIQKFTSSGQFITKWGSQGNGDSQFSSPHGIALDSSGNVYVADGDNHRIQKFTSSGQFITKWGSLGSNACEFSFPVGIAVRSYGQVYISDSVNSRIQVFKKAVSVSKDKAIVVAGSGSYGGNNLWEATEMNANYAYLVLTYRNYTNDAIYYLSSHRNLDLNGDGNPVDGDATNINLQNAITEWAKDADYLVLYLVGHGGDGAFRMSETEVLKAEDFASWLDDLQGTMQGLVTTIYDACESGSFISKFAPPPPGRQRITITSTSPGEPAYFLSQGALSFSHSFWGQIFSGANIYDAYVMAKDVVGVAVGTGKSQNPQIDDNGDGIGNGKNDGDLARDTYIGKGLAIPGNKPLIKTISPDQRLNGQTSATITVEIVSTGKITKVWGVVYSPNLINTSDNPITDLPSFDLTWNEQAGRYEGTYDGFMEKGTYTITVYAINEATIISWPKTTMIDQVLSNQYTLTVTVAPSNAAGSVSKNSNKATYANGESVTLTASPNSGYTFSHWSGDATGSINPITLTMDGNKTVTAIFTQNQYTLTVNITPSGSGSVARNPDKLSYIYGDQVTLTAAPNSGYIFDRWMGGIAGTTNPITVTINGNKTVTANFTQLIGPDLTGEWTTEVTQTCKSTKKGPKCTIKGVLTIDNNGNRDASSSTVKFFLSDNNTYDQGDTPLRSAATGKIKAKKSKVIHLSHSFPVGQIVTDKYIIAVIDIYNSVKEVDETNNIIVFGPIQ